MIYNKGEATWTKPREVASGVGSKGSGGRGGGGQSSARSLPPASARDDPDEWVSYVDDSTGQEYWYNARTGETSWS